MKKILLIDYYGICNREGKAIGHSPKVLEEYGNLLSGEYEVCAAVSPCLVPEKARAFQKVYKLGYDISSENSMSINKRVEDKFKLFLNINEVLKIDGYDIYWFHRTDFFLFFFLCFRNLKRKKGKFIAQIYQTSFGSGWLQKALSWFYNKGMSKFDGITYAQKDMKGMHPNMLYFPDYYYDADKYGKYALLEKKEKVVCLGTMTPYKKLEELVDVFNQNGYPLEIKGHFYDKNFYENLRKKINQNTVLEDKILTEDEYYHTLAEAKYTILPYDMEQYHCRTSGVLIESMFLNTAAIAPKQLLQDNRIEGIGYESLKDLNDISYFEKAVIGNNSDKKREFDREEIARRLKKFMNNI